MEPRETGGSVGRCAGSTTRLEDEEEPALAFSMSSRLEKQIYLRYVLAHARTPTITRILSSDKKKKKKIKVGCMSELNPKPVAELGCYGAPSRV